MKFRNDGNRDLYVFKEHFAAGATVDVSVTDPDKLAWLRRHLTAIEETATATAGAPCDLPDLPTPTKPTKKKYGRRRE